MGRLSELFANPEQDTKRGRLAELLYQRSMAEPAPVPDVRTNAPQVMGGLLGMIDSAKRKVGKNLSELVNNPDQYLRLIAERLPETAMKQASDPGNFIGGGMAGIVKPEVARTLSTVRNVPTDDLFRQAVAGTPGAQIVDDGLMMRVQRNQVPNQSMQPSVRGGVFYLPEGAAQAKYYSTGRNGYGGSEKIAGETLVSNPMFVKGATGGKAPESAYDQLLGGGSYRKMRNDALSTYGTYLDNGPKVEKIYSFLEKYAPELADQAEYIARNSTQGNQLAYALQEAAVGSAVRNAGHDAVLGYSKGKAGPFISEMFDVRESHYPDKFGGSRVWDQFLPK